MTQGGVAGLTLLKGLSCRTGLCPHQRDCALTSDPDFEAGCGGISVWTGSDSPWLLRSQLTSGELSVCSPVKFTSAWKLRMGAWLEMGSMQMTSRKASQGKITVDQDGP